METRPIEMGVALSNGNWYAGVMIDVPADTPKDKLQEVGSEIVLKSPALHEEEVAFIWVYNSMDDKCPEVEIPPRRLRLFCSLSFDADQVTTGTDREQEEAAVDQVNFALQREPYGLGARLDELLQIPA